MENLLELHNKTPVWNDGKTHLWLNSHVNKVYLSSNQ